MQLSLFDRHTYAHEITGGIQTQDWVYHTVCALTIGAPLARLG